MIKVRIQKRFETLVVVLLLAYTPVSAQTTPSFDLTELKPALQRQMAADFSRFVRAATRGDQQMLKRYVVRVPQSRETAAKGIELVADGSVFEERSGQRQFRSLELDRIWYGTWNLSRPLSQRTWFLFGCATYSEGGNTQAVQVLVQCFYRSRHFVFSQLKIRTQKNGEPAPCETNKVVVTPPN